MNRPTRSALRQNLVAYLLLLVSAFAAAQEGSWELRVCGHPDSLPFMNETGEGFENRIAEILAEELDANLAYTWWEQNATLYSTQLGGGTCDLVMGAPDGHQELLTTVAYYRSPYVFVQRDDAESRITSLDDPALHEMRIGIQTSGMPPHESLVQRDLTDNLVLAPTRQDEQDTVLEAVMNDEVDVAIAWGPVAGSYREVNDAPLALTPVTPQFDPPFLSMIVPMTIAVRPGDEALRDTLNRAIAARWNDIQTVLAEYGIPTVDTPAPRLGERDEDTVRIGLVTPIRANLGSRDAALYDFVGDATRMGALLAESDANRNDGRDIKLLLANTPSREAAERAAGRLLHADQVHALIGGIGAHQALVLSEKANDANVPFLNVGSSDPLLRTSDHPFTFNIEADAHSFIEGLTQAHDTPGATRWFIVHTSDEEGARFLNAATDVLTAQEDTPIVGIVSVTPDQPTYLQEIQAADEATADAILLLTRARDQVAFLAQHANQQHTASVAAYPYAVTQTRDFLATVRARTGNLDARISTWDASLQEEADGFNERYASRWGSPADPTAWTAYQATTLLTRAIQSNTSLDDPALRDAIDEAMTRIPNAEFKDKARQLDLPLYLVRIDADAPYGQSVEALTRLANAKPIRSTAQ